MPKLLMRFFLFFLICLTFCGVSLQAWAFSEDEFVRFYSNYHQDPKPAQANEALDYYVQNAGLNEAQATGRARFFAVIAKASPEIWRHAEELFNKSDWPQKKILLEIFKRAKDPALAVSLTTWAQNEQDDDRRLSIQKAQAAGDDPLAILKKPLTEDNLGEQWACFFASGDTRVITASFDQLVNTPTAYVMMSSGKKIKHLRQDICSLLVMNFGQPAVQDLFFQRAGQLPKDQGVILAGLVGEAVLDLGDPSLALRLLPLVDQFIPNTSEQVFFHGGLAALSQKWDEVDAIVRQLEEKDGPWAESLRGFRAYHQILGEEKGWTYSQTPAGGKDLLMACSRALAAVKSWRSYALCHLSANSVDANPKILKLAAAYAGENSRFYYWLKPGLNEAWIIKADHTYCWTSRVRKWSEVGNRLSREQAEALTNPTKLAVLLDQIPVSLNRVTGIKGEKMALAVFRDISVSGLVPHLTNQFPGLETKAEASLVFDQENGQPRLLKMDIKFLSGDQEKARAQVTGVFFDQDATNLSWLENAGR